MTFCPYCGSPNPDSAPVCPACQSGEMQRLSGQAKIAAQSGNLPGARELWRKALALLPKDSVQYQAIQGHLSDLDAQIAATPRKNEWAKRLGKASPFAALLWKFKVAALFILTKGKLLLLGLTKFSTFASMLVSFGFYWTRWGWKFAAGFVLSIFVHEMGHVSALRRFGIAATAPMFIPGFGALIMQKEAAKTPEQDAVVGLAGPLWGTGAALTALAIWALTRVAVWGAIARTGAWINLFNLTPIWFLDGSHAFRALARRERGIIAIAAVAVWAVTRVDMLLLVAALAAFRIFTKDSPERSSSAILIQFLALLAVLGVVAGLPL